MRISLMHRGPREPKEVLNTSLHSWGNLVDAVIELQQRVDAIEAYLAPLQKLGEKE